MLTIKRDGDQFGLRLNSVQLTELTHDDLLKLQAAIKNRVPYATPDVIIRQHADAYTVSHITGEKIADVPAHDMAEFIDKLKELTDVKEENTMSYTFPLIRQLNEQDGYFKHGQPELPKEFPKEFKADGCHWVATGKTGKFGDLETAEYVCRDEEGRETARVWRDKSGNLIDDMRKLK